MSSRRVILQVLQLDVLLGALIVVCQVFDLQGLTSALFYGTFFVTLAFWALSFYCEVSSVDLLAIAIVAIAAVSVMVDAASNQAVMSFGYLKKYCMFCCTVLFLAGASKTRADDCTKAFIARTLICVGIVLMGAFVLLDERMYYIGVRQSNYLTFRFTNPNLTGLFLSCMIMALLAISFEERKPWRKAALLCLAAIEFFFLCQTQARNALMATISFMALLVVFALFRERKVRIPNWVFALVSVFPLVFALAYLALISNSALTQPLSFIASEGKSIGSRVDIWAPALERYSHSPFVGSYYQISNGSGVSQLHNTHIDVLVSYGPVVLILTCAFLFLLMTNAQRRSARNAQTIALVGFICAVFLGLGEAALFSGGLAVYIFVGVFLTLANRCPIDNPENSFENIPHSAGSEPGNIRLAKPSTLRKGLGTRMRGHS